MACVVLKQNVLLAALSAPAVLYARPAPPAMPKNLIIQRVSVSFSFYFILTRRLIEASAVLTALSKLCPSEKRAKDR